MTLVKASEDELAMLVQAVRNVANAQPDTVDRHGEYFLTTWDDEADETRIIHDDVGNPKPGCIVGHAVWSLQGRTIGGADIVDAFLTLNNDTSIGGVIEPDSNTDRAYDLQYFLEEVQGHQDRGKTWAESVALADADLQAREKTRRNEEE